ncbi:alpha/beta fold hydrolase [Mesorhizobium sp. NPDC059054]|uniref:alpha/beta fold hydrolase n=1 Tax=Mesorhizobium sp. NPDC059054 TaxID=3346711 RepID=UPI0036B0E794
MASIETAIVPGIPALAVDYTGEGELVLFLHGIGGNRANWRDQLDVLAAEYKAVALDCRGYGDSEDYEGPVTLDILAQDVLRVMDYFGAERAHICGLSLGGRIAQRFYAHYPHRVASLILADSRPDTVDTRSPEDREAFYALRAKPLLEGKKPADIADRVALSLVAPDTSEAVLQKLRDSISALHAESYLKTIRANLDDDYAGDITLIDVPTLLIVGELDKLTPPELAKGIAAGIGGAQLSIIPNVGHLSNLEDPSGFNAALVSFLRKVKGAQSNSRKSV